MMELHTVPTANGQKAQIILAETGTPHRLSLVDLQAGAHKTAAFRALNPFGKAPVLVDPEGPDGRAITVPETLAIAWYVAEKAGGELLPRTPRERAEFMTWGAAISSSVAMPFSMQFTATVLAPEPTPWLVERMVASCHEMLTAIQDLLGGRDHALGDRFSLVDCLLYPVLATSARRLDGWLDPYPALRRYADGIGARPGIQAGMAAIEAQSIRSSDKGAASSDKMAR